MSLRQFADVVAAAAAGVLLAYQAEGHAYLHYPISRQYARSRDFLHFRNDDLEKAPYAYNAGGVRAVKARAQELTDPDVLQDAGGGKLFPLYYMDRAENGNFLETNEIAKRHGVCGDPRLGRPDDRKPYSTPNTEWQPLETFQSGQEIEINVGMVFYHWGHFEFFLCNVNDLDDPDGVVTQECLNKYPLTRAENANDASVIDPNFRGRYYTDPPCRKKEVEQTVTDNMPAPSYNIKMRYQLPDIECEHCVLQMLYLTGNRCKHIGYDDFDPSWNSDCAPSTADWIKPDVRGLCGVAKSYPEEFWACSDISISSSLSSPSPQATEEPVPATPGPLVAEDVCSNGIPGIEGVSRRQGIATCCPLACGQCGGKGCATAGAASGLDNTACCSNGVIAYYGDCVLTKIAPCVVGTALAMDNGEDGDGYSIDAEVDYGYDPYFEVEPVFPEVEGAFHLGCYEDGAMHEEYDMDNTAMTNEDCVAHCREGGSPYAGTRGGNTCLCGSDSDLIAMAGESSECSMACTGDDTQACGGLALVTTWATGVDPPN